MGWRFHACLTSQGSVYVDSHGEEDISLKRGRPLKLSPLAAKKLLLDLVFQRHPLD